MHRSTWQTPNYHSFVNLRQKGIEQFNLIPSVANYLLMKCTELIIANDKAFSTPFLYSRVTELINHSYGDECIDSSYLLKLS